ncbi:UDP-glucuronate 4-epimerase [Chloropicon primus]|uniref:UDP-glucuronate 4-epimerase n=1 Tax=Chloropicon primus TaxID=1764295 RepID=A0A5B8ME96_9CHLO|nr:UDP-glucuronate 4-epimerase [Chloropicon primus]UPQ96838.1 UDP-glucuronate 4-epimerase [Chloropicon primus]|eukprot:QDZ17622.1 UDP-glucuronate 4-epimerase [Chloropicon primus]
MRGGGRGNEAGRANFKYLIVVALGVTFLVAFLHGAVAKSGAPESAGRGTRKEGPRGADTGAFKRVFDAERARASCRTGGPGKHVVFLTGTGGFVGFHTALELQKQGHGVLGLDNFNDYYETSLKRARQGILLEKGIYTVEGDIADGEFVAQLLEACPFTHVLHLAAQAGVRYAAKNPLAYVHSNLLGFVTLLEAVKKMKVMLPVVYASSSSVYGLNTKVPFSEEDRVDHPASLYAATKKSNEMIAHSYHNIYGMSLTGLRFFTVYGPYGRPDMAYFFFTKYILDGTEIQIFQGPNGEEVQRDFTYVDDIVAGVIGSLETAPPSVKGQATYRLFNLGNTHPETVTTLVENLEEILGKEGRKRVVPMPATGDVLATHANVSAAYEAFGYQPKTDLKTGLRRFVDWYREYYGIGGG